MAARIMDEGYAMKVWLFSVLLLLCAAPLACGDSGSDKEGTDGGAADEAGDEGTPADEGDDGAPADEAGDDGAPADEGDDGAPADEGDDGAPADEGVEAPSKMCGWNLELGYYECGHSGVDEQGEPIDCPEGMVEGDPCGNSGLSGFGCCDANNDSWYCDMDGQVRFESCGE
jgi:hypothetical protein